MTPPPSLLPQARALLLAVACGAAAGCSGYVRSDAPVAPSAEVVRVPFVRPQAFVVRRAITSGSASLDTLRGITAVYGRVMELRGDTIALVITQVSRRGALDRQPSGVQADIDRRTALPVERWGYSDGRTKGLMAMLGGIVVSAAVLFALWVRNLPAT